MKTVARGILILFLILEEKLLVVSMMLAVGVHMWISLSWTFSFIFYLFFNIQWKGIEFLKHSPALIELILGFSLIILLMYLVTVFDFQNITSFIVFTYILVSNTIFSLLTPYFLYIMHINVCCHQSSYLAGKRINILLNHLDSNFTQKKKSLLPSPYSLPFLPSPPRCRALPSPIEQW